MKARPIEEYHEDIGDVLWWKFPIEEPPWVGSPRYLGFPVEIKAHSSDGAHNSMRVLVGGWPGYHTHFTPIEIPEIPPTTGGEHG